LFEKTNVPDVTLFSQEGPSIDNPFSQPTTKELNTEIEEFLLILKAFSNF
jgi:hypothetical protein